ncbi:MAG TPA: type III polyketide synthase [Pantanalinema sp.]
MAHITGLATAVPAHRHAQQAIFRMLYSQAPQAAKVEAIFRRSAIAHRHTVLPDLDFVARNPGTQARNDVYVQEAHKLAAEAVRRCLERAGARPESIDSLVVVSCTGYEIPGLDLTLAKAFGMRADLRRSCILGMGCYAAFPGLARAKDAVLARRGRALMVAVELCSLHYQLDPSPDSVVSSALFADGAAAALLESEGSLELLDAETLTHYDTVDHMAFSMTDNGFRMHLSSYVPTVLATNVAGLLEGLLARNGLRQDQIRHWGIHPGGRKILDHLQQVLGLSDAQLASSRRVLRDYGNMSSPTVLFVLEDLLASSEPQAGDHAILMAFGPGLTMEACLLRWHAPQGVPQGLDS